MNDVVIYLHGFLSSPQSVKAQQVKAYAETHFPQLTLETPELPNYPQDAAKVVQAVVDKYSGRPLRFIGSSMGGYLSTYFAERHDGRAVLINPAVKPWELLADYLGAHVNPYTNVEFVLDESHLQQLLDLNSESPGTPDNFWVLLQTGDETLDYRLAEEKYQQARLTIEQGGDHSFVDFERHIPQIFDFLLDK